MFQRLKRADGPAELNPRFEILDSASQRVLGAADGIRGKSEGGVIEEVFLQPDCRGPGCEGDCLIQRSTVDPQLHQQARMVVYRQSLAMQPRHIDQRDGVARCLR